MESVTKLVEQLDSTDGKTSYQANLALEKLTTAGEAAARQQTAAALAAELNATKDVKDAKGNVSKTPKYSAATRGKVCRLLASVGGDKEVPALKTALADLDTRENARWALDRMTCAAATEALVHAALDDLGPEFRVGVIGALGSKTGPAVLAALKKCATDRDRSVRLAAVESLSRQGDAASDAVLGQVTQRLDARGKLLANDARMRLADGLVRAGKKEEGRKIYQSILTGKIAEQQKKAVQQALETLG